MMKRFAVTLFVGFAFGVAAVDCATAAPILLLNYRFDEFSDDPAPGTTTPDSSNTFTSVSGSVNALLGPGSTPGTDYPIPLTGTNIVSNGTYKSLNPHSALTFTGGTASRVSIAKESVGPLEGNFTDLTVAAWIMPTVTDVDRYIAGKIGGGSASGNRGWQLYRNGTGDLVIDYFQNQSGSPNPNTSITVAGALPQDEWTHIAFTFDGTTPLVYINGISKSFSSTTTDPAPGSINGTNASAFMVGSRGGSNSNSFLSGWVGAIDDVRIYGGDAVLDQAGISALLVPVPEPTGLVLAAIGMIGFAVARRKR